MKNCKNCAHRFGLFPAAWECLKTKTYISIKICGPNFDEWEQRPLNWFQKLFIQDEIPDWTDCPELSKPIYYTYEKTEYVPEEEQDEDNETKD